MSRSGIGLLALAWLTLGVVLGYIGHGLGC